MPQIPQIKVVDSGVAKAEMDTGRVDPRVGSGRVGSGRGSESRQIWRVGSGRNFRNALFFLFVSRLK